MVIVETHSQPLQSKTALHVSKALPRRHSYLSIIIILILIFIIYQGYASWDSMQAVHSLLLDHSTDTKSIFLPFNGGFNNEREPEVKATISGVKFGIGVDTGSTGLLIGAPLLPDIDPTEGTAVYQYFTSSRILYIGRLVDISITFHGLDNSHAVATVAAFIVDKSVVCPWYDLSKDGFNCPLGPGGEEPILRDISRIVYMGVGFGRNKPGSGLPEAVPKRNPFLNITSMNGETVSNRSFHPGYTISSEGVHLGLTKQNTYGYHFTKLDPGVSHREDPRDWAMVRMCFSINEQEANCGRALIDTGVSQMYIRARHDGSIPTITIPNPNPNGRAKEVKRVKPGTKITVNFPSFGKNSEAEYSFIVGGASLMHPRSVIPGRQTPGPFINTGRNFLYGYSIAFDAVGGHFGFRAVESNAKGFPVWLFDKLRRGGTAL